jgi:polysaccharide transporter, PST family
MLKKFRLNKTLLTNFTSLSILQISNYVFPLITFPYLVRVLGPDKFGLVNFAAAFAGYFGVITDFGFNFTATREISINRDDFNKIRIIFSAVMIIKSCFFFICLMIFFALIPLIPFLYIDPLVFIFSFGSILGNLLFPIWFFQGMERMKYIPILNITLKAIVTIFIFVLITNSSDYKLLVLLNSLSFITTGIASLLIVRYKFKIRYISPGINEIKYQLKESWQLFVSNVAINLYTLSNTFILGLFTNNTIVGYFSAADKIRMAFQGIFNTISQTIYPHVSYLFKHSVQAGYNFIKKLFYISGTSGIIISLLIFNFASELVNIILGNNYKESIIILKIISFLPLIIVLSNITGIQTMLNINMKKTFTSVIIIASFINLTLAFMLVPLYREIGTSVSMLITEIFVTVSFFLSLNNKGILAEIFQKKLPDSSC